MKLLLAEDEHELSDVLVILLESYCYTVDTAYDGQSAVELALRSSYDGIIMDVMMPVLDGFEALSRLRAQGVETPLLILSAKSEVPDRVKGLELGANDYLPKPFSTDELLARIRAMTRKSTEQPDEISLENVTLSKKGSALTTTSSSVRLSNKEREMMELLMRFPNTPQSVARIFDEIWKKDETTDETVVWLYASYLQKKLEAVGGGLCLEMLRDEQALTLKLLTQVG